MPSSYTTSLKLTLPVTGELTGTWGDVVNDGITSLIDASVAGASTITMLDADYTLTSVDGATDEARKMFIVMSGTLTGAKNVICPAASKLYFVKNSTTGGFAVTFKTSAGTGISVPNGKVMALQVSGGNVVDAITYFSSLDVGTLNATTLNATTLDLTNLEVTNIKAKDGTTAITLADSTGVATIAASPIVSSLTASQAVFSNGSKNLVSNAITGTGNVVMSASPTLTGTISAAAANFSGAVALGDAAADNITVNGTVTSNVIFTDNTYDIGASGATRPRNLFLAGNATVGGDIVLTGALDVTNLEVTNIKAKDGTASISLADTTGIATFSKATVISTTDNTNAALRITQLGNGNALLVEDSTNPDSTPTVINTDGRLVVGYSAALVMGAGITPSIQSQGNTTNTSGIGSAHWGTSATGAPTYVFSKSKSGTVGTQGIVASGDYLGQITWNGDDGAAFISAASVRADVDGTPGLNDMPGRLVFSTTPDGSATPTERVRIDSAGQTTFNYNAVISTTDNTNAALRITQLGTGNALLVEDSANPDASPFVIDASGRIIDGTTTSINAVGTIIPQIQLHGTTINTTQEGIYSWSTTSSTAGTKTFLKSKSGIIGTYGVVGINDTLGVLSFAGDDGTAFIEAARITSAVDGTPGTNDMPGRLIFSTTADGASTPTERMRINSAGNVGIGTSSPAVKLDVAGTIRATSATITGAAGGTITPTSDDTNQYTVTALGAAATFAIPSGTPIDGQKLTIRIEDNGTARALTWTTSAGGYRVIGTTLPTTTIISKTVYIGCIYNSADSFWDVVAVAQQA